MLATLVGSCVKSFLTTQDLITIHGKSCPPDCPSTPPSCLDWNSLQLKVKKLLVRQSTGKGYITHLVWWMEDWQSMNLWQEWTESVQSAPDNKRSVIVLIQYWLIISSTASNYVINLNGWKIKKWTGFIVVNFPPTALKHLPPWGMRFIY